jgi:hypothetical protein
MYGREAMGRQNVPELREAGSELFEQLDAVDASAGGSVSVTPSGVRSKNQDSSSARGNPMIARITNSRMVHSGRAKSREDHVAELNEHPSCHPRHRRAGY